MLKKARASSSPALHYFGDNRCRSIWQWQLIIALTVVTMSVGVALLTPTRFSDGRFSIGVVAPRAAPDACAAAFGPRMPRVVAALTSTVRPSAPAQSR